MEKNIGNQEEEKVFFLRLIDLILFKLTKLTRHFFSLRGCLRGGKEIAVSLA